MHARRLERTERRLQGVITEPGGFGSSGGFEMAGSMLRMDCPLPAADGLAIYRNAYWSRLLECLQKEYAVLRQAFGHDLFDTFALAYLEASPPKSYTLADLGAGFPDHLSASRPGAVAGTQEPDWSDFFVDLASLERTFHEIFDAPAGTRRSLRCRYPVHQYFTEARKGRAPDFPAAGDCSLAVFRSGQVVRIRTSTPPSRRKPSQKRASHSTFLHHER